MVPLGEVLTLAMASEAVSLSKREIVVSLHEQLRKPESGPDAWLVFAPLKHERIDYLAQKATEMGVSELRPVMTKHTAVNRVNVGKLRANAIEAAEALELDNAHFVISREQYEAFLAELDKSPKAIPALKKLFSEPGVLDEPAN